LIVTQGEWGGQLLAAAEKILGRSAGVEQVALGWDEDPVRSLERLRAAIARTDQGEGVLLLTDLFGGTPARIAMSLLAPDRVEVLAGLNLPMIVRLGCPGTESLSLGALARWLQAKVVDSVRLGSDCAVPKPGCGVLPRMEPCADD
jgi:PTS system mannose-specific IIA component